MKDFEAFGTFNVNDLVTNISSELYREHGYSIEESLGLAMRAIEQLRTQESAGIQKAIVNLGTKYAVELRIADIRNREVLKERRGERYALIQPSDYSPENNLDEIVRSGNGGGGHRILDG